MNRVYLDHNATTPLRPQVRDRWMELLDRGFGNPSSLHASGRAARNIVDEAREIFAKRLAVSESEIVFTSGGTESNNLALLGTLQGREIRGSVITSPLEHPSVLEPLEALAKEGHEVRFTKVNRAGRIHPEQVAFQAESGNVSLISLHLANNEVGVVQPISELACLLSGFQKGPRPLLHVDAVQALGRIPLDLDGKLAGVDLVSLSMHKIGGPLGVGVLVRRAGSPLCARTFGGGQEDELRAGTENAPAIAAAALALELALGEQDELAQRQRKFCGQIWQILSARFPQLILAGPPLEQPSERLPNTLNIRMPGTDARMLVTRFDMEGLELSAGSACASGAVEPSHVLLGMGLSEEEARSGLRISLGWSTSEGDCKSAVERMVKVFSSSHATSDSGTTL